MNIPILTNFISKIRKLVAPETLFWTLFTFAFRKNPIRKNRISIVGYREYPYYIVVARFIIGEYKSPQFRGN